MNFKANINTIYNYNIFKNINSQRQILTKLTNLNIHYEKAKVGKRIQGEMHAWSKIHNYMDKK